MLKKIWQASAKAGYSAEALAFEEQTGLKDVGCRYVMPADLPMPVMYAMLPRNDASRMDNFILRARLVGLGICEWHDDTVQKMQSKIAEAFIRLNPELDKINFTGSEAGMFCAGVASGYNPDDIMYGMQRMSEALRSKSGIADPYISELNERCVALFGQADLIQWIPSPETAERVHRQLDARFPALAPSQ